MLNSFTLLLSLTMNVLTLHGKIWRNFIQLVVFGLFFNGLMSIPLLSSTFWNWLSPSLRNSTFMYTHQFFSGTLCWQRLKKLACKWNLANQKNYFTIYVILYSKVEVASFNGYSYIHSSRNSHFLKLSIDPFWLSIANFSNFIFH